MHPITLHTAEHYTWGQNCDGWHLVKNDSLSIIEERMPPGTTEVRHLHHRARQFFHILSGEATMEVQGNIIHLHSGEGLPVSPGVPHQMKNESRADLHFLVISHPPSHGDREVAP